MLLAMSPAMFYYFFLVLPQKVRLNNGQVNFPRKDFCKNN
jgi:hypothetical protein